MRKKISVAFISALLLISCRKQNNPSTSSNGQTLPVHQNSIYFSTSDYASRTAQVYEFDTRTQTALEEPFILSNLDGLKGFLQRNTSGLIENLYLTQYIAGASSSPTTQFNANGSAHENTQNMPQNIYDMLINNGSLYSIGYDKKEISITSPTLNNITLSHTTISSFDSNKTYDVNNFAAILTNTTNTYILTSGYIYNKEHPIENPQSLLYSLNSTNITSTPIEQLNIKDGNKTCYNAYTTLHLNNSQILVSCNPPSEILSVNTPQATPMLFLIDVSESRPQVHFLFEASEPKNELILGGVSQDHNNIFVTEISDTESYTNPKISRAGWLNVTTPQTVLPFASQGSGAFGVAYNAQTNSYIFDCVLNNSNHCQDHTFGIAPNNSQGLSNSSVNPVTLDSLPNTLSIRNISFFKEF